MGLGFSLQGSPQPGVLFQTLHLCCKAPCLMLTDLLPSQVCDATASSQFQIKNPIFFGPHRHRSNSEICLPEARRQPQVSGTADAAIASAGTGFT